MKYIFHIKIKFVKITNLNNYLIKQNKKITDLIYYQYKTPTDNDIKGFQLDIITI